MTVGQKGTACLATSYIVAAAFFAAATALGVFAIPKLGAILTEMVPEGSLPVLTRVILSVGLSGYLGIALFGTAALLLTACMRRNRWTHGAVIIVLAIILGLTLLGLFSPLYQLISPAA